MSSRHKKFISAGVLVLVLAAPIIGHAGAVKDLGVAGRALTFLNNGPSGNAVLGVVFDPSKPASVAEKDEIMGALGSGYPAGSVTLTGKPVGASDVGGVAGVAALYITDGVNFGAVGAAAKARKLVTVGSQACAESGACVMGVSTDPKVEITVNKATAAAVGASFKAAFSMMIHEF